MTQDAILEIARQDIGRRVVVSYGRLKGVRGELVDVIRSRDRFLLKGKIRLDSGVACWVQYERLSADADAGEIPLGMRSVTDGAETS